MMILSLTFKLVRNTINATFITIVNSPFLLIYTIFIYI